MLLSVQNCDVRMLSHSCAMFFSKVYFSKVYFYKVHCWEPLGFFLQNMGFCPDRVDPLPHSVLKGGGFRKFSFLRKLTIINRHSGGAGWCTTYRASNFTQFGTKMTKKWPIFGQKCHFWPLEAGEFLNGSQKWYKWWYTLEHMLEDYSGRKTHQVSAPSGEKMAPKWSIFGKKATFDHWRLGSS